MASSRNSLSTKAVELRQAVAACLEQQVLQGKRLCVALSGGIDSMVLLDACQALAAQYAVSLSALHVHHGLSANADSWASFCRAQCEARRIPLVIEYVAVPRDSGEGIEGAARRVRHACFARVDADGIALAHHQGDQAETVLLNLLRGAGVRGAAAMLEQNKRLLRPLLHCSREAILAYAAACDLQWIEDESNADNRYSRNFLRNEVLPLLKQRFPAAEQSLANAAAHFGTAQALLDELALLDLGAHPARFPLSIGVLRELSESRARNVLRYLLARHEIQTASALRLDELLRQMIEAGPDKHPQIRFGAIRLTRRKGKIELN